MSQRRSGIGGPASCRELREPIDAQLVAADRGHPAPRQCAQRRIATLAGDDGTLSDDGTGSQLRHDGPIDLDREHTVQKQVDINTRVTLFDERTSLAQLAEPRLRTGSHDVRGEFTLQSRFERRDKRW